MKALERYLFISLDALIIEDKEGITWDEVTKTVRTAPVTMVQHQRRSGARYDTSADGKDEYTEDQTILVGPFLRQTSTRY